VSRIAFMAVAATAHKVPTAMVNALESPKDNRKTGWGKGWCSAMKWKEGFAGCEGDPVEEYYIRSNSDASKQCATRAAFCFAVQKLYYNIVYKL